VLILTWGGSIHLSNVTVICKENVAERWQRCSWSLRPGAHEGSAISPPIRRPTSPPPSAAGRSPSRWRSRS